MNGALERAPMGTMMFELLVLYEQTSTPLTLRYNRVRLTVTDPDVARQVAQHSFHELLDRDSTALLAVLLQRQIHDPLLNAVPQATWLGPHLTHGVSPAYLKQVMQTLDQIIKRR